MKSRFVPFAPMLLLVVSELYMIKVHGWTPTLFCHPPRTGRYSRLATQYDDNDVGENQPSVGTSNDSDDDGWFDKNDEQENDKLREIRSLQQQRRSAATGMSSNSQRSTVRGTEEQERDLFIPIFAVVAILGLFGSYGYEMVRLASRGELYLPWDS